MILSLTSKYLDINGAYRKVSKYNLTNIFRIIIRNNRKVKKRIPVYVAPSDEYFIYHLTKYR